MNALTTLLLPDAVIVGLALVSFFIEISKFEERVALLVTSVLSAILLRVSMAKALLQVVSSLLRIGQWL